MSGNREILMKFITGQNEKVKQDISMQGYKDDSPYRNNPSNTIYGTPQGTSITMQGVSTPLIGMDEFGNKQQMFPGQKYQYPGTRVVEMPIAQEGGPQEEFNNVKTWFNKYIESPLYKENLEKSGYKDVEKVLERRQANVNRTKYKLDENRDGSYYNTGSNTIHHSPNRDLKQWVTKDKSILPNDNDSVLAHEFGHSVLDSSDSIIGSNVPYYNQYDYNELQSRNKNNKMSRGADENYADQKALQYEAAKLGIYNPGYEEFTQEHLNQLKNTGRKNRALENYSDEDLIWLMNNIAQNNDQSEMPIAKYGGLLNKTIKCSNCGWLWKAADGGNDVSTCHKCGNENKIMQNGGNYTGNWFKNADVMSVSNKYQKAGTVKYGTPEYEKAYNRGEVVTEDGQRSPILLDEVTIQNNYKRPRGFWEQSRDKYLKDNADDGLLGAIGSVVKYPASVGQHALTYATTGKVQDPSEAWGHNTKEGWFDSPSAFGRNLDDTLLNVFADPANLIGAGILTKEKALSKLGSLRKLPFFTKGMVKGKIPKIGDDFANAIENIDGEKVFYDSNATQNFPTGEWKYMDELPNKGGISEVEPFNNAVDEQIVKATYGKKPLVAEKDFYTDKELADKIAKEKNYWNKYFEFADEYPLSDADIVFDKKFPELVPRSFQEKFMTPEQYQNTKSKLSLFGDIGHQDITNPTMFKKTLASDWNNAKAFDAQDFQNQMNNTIFERTGKVRTANPDYLKSLIMSDEILTPDLLNRMGNMESFGGVDAFKTVSPNKYGGEHQRYDIGGTTGNGVAEQYTKLTGQPWSTARAQGLTDGSMQQNLALIEKILKKQRQDSMVAPPEVEVINPSDRNVHTKEMAQRVVQIAEDRIKTGKYIAVPDDLKKAAVALDQSANSCIGGVCDVYKEAGVMKNIDWSNTSFSKNAKEYGFTANNGYGVKGITNLEPGDMLQRNNRKNEQGNFYPGHAQIYLGKNANGELRFFDNFWKTERTYSESDVADLLDRARTSTEPSASIYKVNPYNDANPLGLTPEEKQNYEDKKDFVKKESASKASYKWSISPNAKNYNNTTKNVMDKFLLFANDNDKVNDLVKKTGKSKEEIQDSLLNVFGELGAENNWTTSRGKGLGSLTENIAESVLTSVGGGKRLSVGPGQIKFNSIPTELKQKFGIQSPNDLYNMEKVLPLMTAMDLQDKQVLENWGEQNKLSKNLFGFTRPEMVNADGTTSGGFQTDDLYTDVNSNALDDGVGRYSPYLRNQFSSIASGTTWENDDDYIPFNEGTMSNFTEGAFTESGEDEMRQKYQRDPGSYPYKVEQNWRNNLYRQMTPNEDGAMELNEVTVKPKKKR